MQWWLLEMRNIMPIGKIINFYKLKEVKTGVSFYEAHIENEKVVWKHDMVVRHVKIDDYERNFALLDYTPGFHDPIIVRDITREDQYDDDL